MAIIDIPTPPYLQEPELDLFAENARRFFERNASPEETARWRENGSVDRDLWTRAGEAGLLLVSTPEAYGGGGGDFRHDAILLEMAPRMGAEGLGLPLQNVIVPGYILAHGTEEQKQRWLPRLATGELVAAVAMTEPQAGSDLKAIRATAERSGDHYRINGTKTFISNGQQANLICVVARTGTAHGADGLSLIFVETEVASGFERGKNLKKMGNHAQDTAELFFQDVEVPVENLLGTEEGKGFTQLMHELPKERLLIALHGIGAMEYALDETITYVKQRQVFGKKLIELQNTQFKLAECKTEATVAKVFVQHCISRWLEGTLDGTTSAMAKLWVSEAQGRIIDECLQFFGGYGYMEEYPISRLYTDARVQRIYGGANEIMKLLIARTL